MPGYENVVVGKLGLKGKTLDVRDAGIKERKKHKERNIPSYHAAGHDQFTDIRRLDGSWTQIQNGREYDEDERLTLAERRYTEQLQKIELERLARKSHHYRIQEFNQYLANLSEHYDIPKVGPG